MFQGKIDYNEIVTKLNGFSLEFHECAKFRFEWSGRNLHSFNRIFAVIATDGNSEVIHEQSGKKYTLKTGGIYFLSNGETYKFHLIPSGILYDGKICFLGAGVVLHPETFFDEINDLKKRISQEEVGSELYNNMIEELISLEKL